MFTIKSEENPRWSTFMIKNFMFCHKILLQKRALVNIFLHKLERNDQLTSTFINNSKAILIE